MSDYSDRDFPWTFYFNGEAMPKWGQCWMACALEKRAREEMREWDERITGQDLWLLWCRIDHVGLVDSEEVLRFRVMVRVMLKVVLVHEQAFEEEANTWGARYGVMGKEVVRGIRGALMGMSSLAERDGVAMWVTGYEADRGMLSDRMRRVRLPADAEGWVEMPHVIRDRIGAELRLELLRKELVGMVHAGGIPEDVRRVVHGMRKER